MWWWWCDGGLECSFVVGRGSWLQRVACAGHVHMVSVASVAVRVLSVCVAGCGAVLVLLRCRRGRGSRMPPGVRCVRCVRLKPCTCTLVPCGYIALCLHFDECSFVRGVFAIRSAGRGQSTEERRQPQAQRWAVRAAEGLEPCPRPWVPSYYTRSIDIVQIHRSKTKPSDAMVRRATNLEHRPPPTARQGAEEETHGKAHLRASARPRTNLKRRGGIEEDL